MKDIDFMTKNNDRDKDLEKELKPTDGFLTKLIGKKIKVFYWVVDESFGTSEEPVWFEGTVIGYDEFAIAIESDTDYKKIGKMQIETIYLKNNK